MAGEAKAAPKFVFSLDQKFAQGAIQLDPSSHPELLTSLLDPNAALPTGDVTIGGVNLSVAPGKNITVGPANVSFSVDANAAVGVFSTPATVRRAALQNVNLVSEIADTLAFSGPPGAKFLALRWGYDIAGTAAGNVALGSSANLNFSANADRKGYYALVRAVPADAKAKKSLEDL